MSSTFVDDIFADDLDSARKLRDELIKLLSSGGFPLKKWVSNHPQLVADLPEGDRLRPQWRDFGAYQPVRTLGIAWDPVKDEFWYRVPELPNCQWPSKRSILSVIARLRPPRLVESGDRDSKDPDTGHVTIGTGLGRQVTGRPSRKMDQFRETPTRNRTLTTSQVGRHVSFK